MKALFQCTMVLLALGIFVACGNSPKGEAAKTSDKTEKPAEPTAASSKYQVDVQNSSVMWTGTKPIGDAHSGTIKLKGGELAVAGGNITACSFEFDMNSIENTDMKAGDGKEKLEEHLKSADFFDVTAYPTAKFTVTGAQPVTGKAGVTHQLTGNLTMRDQTKSITFDVNVAQLSDRVTAVTPSFTINRTEWGVNYHSGILGTVKDQLINDDVALVINLVATPQ